MAMVLAGCAGFADRRVILDQLSPQPMSPAAWGRVVGTYMGPVRVTTQRGGFEGENTVEMRLDLSGWADAPEATMKMDSGFSTAWAMYGERKGLYSNVPAKRYGSQGELFVSTHAPNQMLIEMRRFGISPNIRAWLILTFEDNGNVSVDWIGHSGWRGDGELWRVMKPPGPDGG